MEKIEKTNYLNALFDLYEGLLTPKQATYFRHYYFEDETLQEISDIYQVSRHAIFDQLDKVAKILVRYEEVLGLYQKSQMRLDLWAKYDQTQDSKLLIEIRKVDDVDGK